MKCALLLTSTAIATSAAIPETPAKNTFKRSVEMAQGIVLVHAKVSSVPLTLSSKLPKQTAQIVPWVNYFSIGKGVETLIVLRGTLRNEGLTDAGVGVALNMAIPSFKQNSSISLTGKPNMRIGYVSLAFPDDIGAVAEQHNTTGKVEAVWTSANELQIYVDATATLTPVSPIHRNSFRETVKCKGNTSLRLINIEQLDHFMGRPLPLGKELPSFAPSENTLFNTIGESISCEIESTKR